MIPSLFIYLTAWIVDAISFLLPNSDWDATGFVSGIYWLKTTMDSWNGILPVWAIIICAGAWTSMLLGFVVYRIVIFFLKIAGRYNE